MCESSVGSDSGHAKSGRCRKDHAQIGVVPRNGLSHWTRQLREVVKEEGTHKHQKHAAPHCEQTPKRICQSNHPYFDSANR